MKKKARIKQPAPIQPVAQTREDVCQAIADIGIAQRHRARVENEMNDRLAAMKKSYEEVAKVFSEQISLLAASVQIYCEANRAELTQEGKSKTVQLTTGEVKWRNRPKKVNLTKVEDVLIVLKELALDRFIRVKSEVNKEAILEDPEAVKHVKGINVSSGEDFIIVPFESALEEVL